MKRGLIGPSWRRLLLLLFLLLWQTPPAVAMDGDFATVTVQGEALIEGQDLPRARNRALQEAFSTALTQVMGTYLTADSYTRNFESIDRNVYSRTEGYIKTYEILRESPDGELLQITVRAVVSTEPLKDELTAMGILLDAFGNPSVAVEAHEQGVDDPVSARYFAAELAGAGFQVQSSVADPHEVSVRLDGQVQSVNEIGGVGMVGAVVRLDAGSSWRSSGRTIAAIHETANGAGLSREAALQDAYNNAAQRAFPNLLKRMTSAMQTERNAGRLVTLRIQAAELRDVTAFKRRLGRLFGVDGVDLKDFQPGRSLLQVRFRGNAPQLAELMQMTDFRQQTVRVTGIDSEAVAVSLGAAP